MHLLSKPENTFSTRNRLVDVLHYIERNLNRNLVIRELASEACMSESHFYRTFKQTFGATPIDYVNQQRIAVASSLLQTTNHSLAAISQACGFTSVTYFMKLFRRKTGISPTRYRKQAPAVVDTSSYFSSPAEALYTPTSAS